MDSLQVAEVMMDHDKARRAAGREAALKTMGLVVLLARGEGRLTFTREEYDEILIRVTSFPNLPGTSGDT